MPVNITSWLEKLDLPKLTSCNDVIHIENAVIIAAAGFEDRTLAFSSRLVAKNCTLGLAVYKDWAKENRTDDIVASYGSAGIDRDEITFFEYDRFCLLYTSPSPRD